MSLTRNQSTENHRIPLSQRSGYLTPNVKTFLQITSWSKNGFPMSLAQSALPVVPRSPLRRKILVVSDVSLNEDLFSNYYLTYPFFILTFISC